MPIYGRIYGRLGEGYPLQVVWGSRIAMNQLAFNWRGPDKTLYACWGLKNDRAHFENGLALEGGKDKFGYAAIQVKAPTDTWYAYNQTNLAATQPLLIRDPMRQNVKYSMWIWISYAPTVLESDAVPVEGGDNYMIADNTVWVRSAQIDCTNAVWEKAPTP